MSGELVADPLARTVLAWQRTLLGLAGLTVLVAVALSRAGYPPLGVLVLTVALLPLPGVVARQRELLGGSTAPIRAGVLVPVAVAGVALAAAALIAVVA
jgi:hypothetical protein